jgi:Fe-S cluster assembly protein SufD
MDAVILAYAKERSRQADGTFKELRDQHLHLLESEGLLARAEDYLYTPILRHIEKLDYQSAPVSMPMARGADLAFVNGRLSGELPQIAGLKITRLKDTPAAADKYLSHRRALSNLHHVLLEDGIIIEVERNFRVEKPLRITHQYTQGISAPLIIIRAQSQAELTIIEESQGLEAAGLLSEVYLELAAAARVDHLQLDRAPAKGLQHGSTFATVARDASYRNFIFHLGGELNRRNLEVKMTEAGANGESYCLYLTDKSERSDISTVLEHMAADTTSHQLAKGILDGESRGAFTGKIHIHPKAQRVASGQLNKNLILSRKAQANSRPQLEIFADDVKCSHGSTTGQLSPEELFYFEARGIPNARARMLLARGFGMEIVLKINHTLAREQVAAVILQSLQEKFGLGGAR